MTDQRLLKQKARIWKIPLDQRIDKSIEIVKSLREEGRPPAETSIHGRGRYDEALLIITTLQDAIDEIDSLGAMISEY